VDVWALRTSAEPRWVSHQQGSRYRPETKDTALTFDQYLLFIYNLPVPELGLNILHLIPDRSASALFPPSNWDIAAPSAGK